MRGRGRPGERAAKPAISVEVSTDSTLAKPAICGTVSTDAASPAPTRAPSASACEPYRELIVEALGRGRNAVAIWQDLVDDHGFSARYASVRRFVLKLRGAAPAEARVVITTAPGEEGQVDYGDGEPFHRNVEPTSPARLPSTDFAKPVNGETGTFPRRTADSTQGARGWFLVGADVPDEGESQTREKSRHRRRQTCW